MSDKGKDKIVPEEDMFFKDDIQIIDVEVASALSMPSNIPIFSREELQIFYNGHVFVATKNRIPDAEIKIYKLNFSLKEIESPKEQEDKYFKDNKTLIDKLKEDFIERSVNGVSVLDDESLKGTLESWITSELIEKITQGYASCMPEVKSTPTPGKGLITKADDGSVFNAYMKNFERALVVDGKLYLLETIAEYVSKFSSKQFESDFYKKMVSSLGSITPEEFYKLLTDNADKVHRKVLSAARNKVWHSDRSFKLLLDSTYWVPEFQGKADTYILRYRNLLERKVKIDAAKEFGK